MSSRWCRWRAWSPLPQLVPTRLSGRQRLSRRPRPHWDRAGLTVDDIDWWEVHESSAVAVQVLLAEMNVGDELVNPTGGALATTAPLGAVGAGLFVAAVSGLVEAGLRRALVCVAAEGGIGTACVLERG